MGVKVKRVKERKWRFAGERKHEPILRPTETLRALCWDFFPRWRLARLTFAFFQQANLMGFPERDLFMVEIKSSWCFAHLCSLYSVIFYSPQIYKTYFFLLLNFPNFTALSPFSFVALEKKEQVLGRWRTFSSCVLLHLNWLLSSKQVKQLLKLHLSTHLSSKISLFKFLYDTMEIMFRK